MDSPRTFDDLIAEAEAAPVDGWDFSWFDGRAREERPSWGYARQLGERMALASAALDVQSGGGEVLATVPDPPRTLCATESWPPNVRIARRRLAALDAQVVQVADDQPLPFQPETFDLIVSRHPTVVALNEIARVLRPGGTYFAQLVGAGTNRELYEFLMGPQPEPGDLVARLRSDAAAAGLDVMDLREAALRVEFDDIAAVVVFLRKVLWTVPDFTVDRYRARLADLHARIGTDGPFVSHSQRILFEAVKPVN